MSNTSVTKRTVKRMSIVSGGGGDDGDFEGGSSSFRQSRSGGTSSSSSSYHTVFRGMSPTTASRLENRVKELEEALEQERAAHLRTEKELTEIRFSFDSLHERLDEAEAEISNQNELNRRKDQDIAKVKKDLDVQAASHEASESSLKKRHQELINDLQEQLDRANKQKAKAEKDKQTLVVEIETYTSQLDASNKAKSYAESKLENLEEQVRKLKAQVDDLTRFNQDLTNIRNKLTQENADLQRQVHDLDTNFGSSSKIKIQIQQQLDETKNKLDEESRIRSQLELQFNGLQDENSNLKGQLDEESEAAANFKSQAAKWQSDFQQLKLKYDKDYVSKSEELEEIRRKLTTRITELETEVEQGKSRASRLEKEKNKLTLEIHEIVIQLEGAEVAANENAKRLKQAEHANGELFKRVEELTVEVKSSGGDNERLQAEVARLKHLSDDLQSKLDALNREHTKQTEALREAESNVKDLTRQSQEWTQIKIELLGERDNVASQLGDAHDALKDLQARLDSANASANQSKAEFDARIREREDELENTRKTSQRSIEDLQRSLTELESKLKGEASRLKKKYETEIHEFELQIDNLNRGNAELAKNNKFLSTKLKETEVAVESERRAAQEARDAASAAEKRAISLHTELEDIRIMFDGADKARKHAESELHDSSVHLNEINITISALTTDKRRLEGDVAAAQRDRDEASSARRSAEERAEKLSLELNRLSDQLRTEKETTSRLESVRKQLEVSIKEITIKLEESESTKDGKKTLTKLQARISELEHELEIVSRRERDAVAENSKLKRQLQELRTQSEGDHHLVIEYTEQINILQTKISTIRRQLESSEEVLNITMAKYRKTQQLLEEAERRADRAENSMTVVRRQSVQVTRGPGGSVSTRAMSVSRDARSMRS